MRLTSISLPIIKTAGLLTLTCFLLCSAQAEEAEEDYATGFIPEKQEAYAAMPKVGVYRAYLPPTVDMSDDFPTPGSQKKQGSCAAWATGYAVRSYFEKRNQDWDANDPSHQFSPAFIYNQIKQGGCKDGSVISDALDLLKDKGAVSLNEFPYDPQDCSRLPDAQTLAKASQFRIADWKKVDETKLDTIKGQLYKGKPVIIGMSISDDFKKLRGVQVYDNPSEPDPNNGHAMVLVGYDDNKQAFKLINSWGTAWGDKGFGWVSYATFLKRIQNSFVMEVEENATKKPVEKPKPAFENKPLSTEELNSKLTEMLNKVGCAKLNGAITKARTVHLTGFAGQRADIENLQSQLQTLGLKSTSAVDFKPWPQCEILSNFHQALTKPTDLKVTVVGKNQTVLHDGEQLTIEVTTPSYPSYVYVTYIQANGEAVHLVQPDMKDPTLLNPNSKLIFGDGKNGRALFKIRKPFGNEIIVAIATPVPLFNTALPRTQIERDYLSQFNPIFLGFSDTNAAVPDISAAVATLVTQP